MSTALFWVITQRVMVFSDRRFGTTYRISSSGAKILDPEDGMILASEYGTDRLSRNVSNKLPLVAA